MEQKMKKEKRFRLAQDEMLDTGAIASIIVASIIVDSETGVNYLLVSTTYGTSITPLLGDGGQAIITKND
jgi:hypothetical protein